MLGCSASYQHLVRAAESLIGSTVCAGADAMQRSFADAIEASACRAIQAAIEPISDLQTKAPRSRRSIEDISVESEGMTSWVDIKSKDLGGTFSMPNLISIQRLWGIFQNPAEELIFIFLDYDVIDAAQGIARIVSAVCVQADRMNPKSLHIQNLGLGQLQLKPDASSETLEMTGEGVSLRTALPGMAAEFHRKQMEKVQREMALWTDRILPEAA
jgi:hypothetical protein